MFFLNKLNHPIKTNCQTSDMTEITEQQYILERNELNSKAEANWEALMLSLKPQQDYEKKIQDKLREMAIKEIEKET